MDVSTCDDVLVVGASGRELSTVVPEAVWPVRDRDKDVDPHCPEGLRLVLNGGYVPARRRLGPHGDGKE